MPTLLLLMALLLQPACLLYTRVVMRGAAAEAVRVLATSGASGDADCRDFILRRLSAVPEVPLFHVGGRSDWDVGFERSEKSVTVLISGHVRPLPLLGVAARALGTPDDVGVRLDVQVSEQVRATWVEGSYEAWIRMWQ